MRLKRLFVLFILVTSFLLGGCQFLNSVSDLTDSATELMQESETLLREINTKVETGELEKDIANLAEEMIGKLIEQLSSTLQENGGVLFDSANNTINLIFNNISNQLEQIRTGILNDSLPNLIQTISADMQLQLMMLSSEAQDIIMLASGNVFVAVDKATNSAVMILSMIFLAIGLLILTIAMLKSHHGLTKTKVIGLVFGCTYIIFFLLVIFVAPLRGYIIAGFDYGVKVEARAMQPKITSAFPEKFIFGETDSITIYGNHLNLIEDLSIKLVQGSEIKNEFTDSLITIATQYKIVLGNLNKAGRSLFTSLHSVNSFSERPQKVTAVNKLTPKFPPLRDKKLDVDTSNLKKPIVANITTSNFSQEWVGLQPGDYGICVYSGDQRVESPQHIRFENPVLPAPKSDIIPVRMSWTTPAVENKPTSMRVTLKVTNPGGIKRSFYIKLTPATPGGNAKTKEITMATVSAAAGKEFDVIIDGVTPTRYGNNEYELLVDSSSYIEESDETNNKLKTTLKVGKYVYNAKVSITAFNPLRSYDSTTDEYRVTVKVNLNGQKEETKNIAKDGEPGHSYAVNWSVQYSDLEPGAKIYLYTTGYESDSDTPFDPDDKMGEASNIVEVKKDMTRQYPILLRASGFEIVGNIEFIQKRVE